MANMPGMNESTPVSPAGASSSAVCITPARQQLIGVRTGLVKRQSVSGTVRTVGVLAHDETRVAILAILLGLLPIMRSHGAGSDVMSRIAAPMVGAS
jgi:Cu/Ag efflux pump CusA